MELKNAGVADVAIRSDDKIFASGGWDGRYRINLPCFDLTTDYGIHNNGTVFGLFCCCLIMCRIRVFGFKKGKPLAILNYHSSTVNCLAFPGPSAQTENRNLLVCGSKDKRISLWRLY